MGSLIPYPSIEHFPKALDNQSAEAVALGAKIDSIFYTGFCADICAALKNVDPIRCNSILVNNLNHWVNGGVLQFDDEVTKRSKIATAIERHKNSGRWDKDYKPLIDAITGLDAQIVRAIDSADWIKLGGETSEPDYYWATFGHDAMDIMLGIDLIGAGTEVEIAGNIYIDLGGDAINPSATKIAQIVDSLTIDGLPAYLTLYMGYRTETMFTIYPGGVI